MGVATIHETEYCVTLDNAKTKQSPFNIHVGRASLTVTTKEDDNMMDVVQEFKVTTTLQAVSIK